MSKSISYERTGRTTQKARTRAALLDAARRLLAAGRTPSVEDAAEAAAVSRATAYRYFPNRRALLVAAHPEVEATDLLGEDAPEDARERLDRTIAELIRITVDTEPELRTMLRLSLEPGPGHELLLRQGRAIGWIEKALAPLQARLDPDVFWRVHRSHLVNINKIKEIVPWFSRNYILRMKDAKATEIPVSRSQTKRLREYLKL